MVRSGQFLGPSQVFGAPLAIVKPPDNDVTKSRYHPSLLDPSLKLTEDQMRDLQNEINELYRTLQLGRDLP